MARLALGRDALPDYGHLDHAVRRRLDDTFAALQSDSGAVSLDRTDGRGSDHRVRLLPFDPEWHAVVIADEAGDVYVVVRVLPRDRARDWAERHAVVVNPATGALEIEDRAALAAVGDQVPADAVNRALLADRSDQDLVAVGLPADLVPLLRRVATAAELQALVAVMPPGQGDALTMLVAGTTVDDIIAQLVGGEVPGDVDPGDLVAALDRPATQLTFQLVEGESELRAMLDQPFALWRTFLHPQQRRLAQRGSYSGPVRVTGGAGTGKTVVALHRARALADRTDEPILFTTFTRNLAGVIEDQLEALGGAQLRERVEVLNIDRLAYRIVRDAEGINPAVAGDRDEERVWRAVVADTGSRFSVTFLRQEWRQIILAQGVSTRADYLRARRAARGVRLSRRDRSDIWTICERVVDGLRSQGRRTHLQLAADAAGYLTAGPVRPYAHVIVDEAQDLHAAQWRLLRAVVREQSDDLFIVGDAHQRIYDNRVSLSSVGINVRGRSHRLRINYRTTQEIVEWATHVLSGEVVDDLDDGVEDLAGYRCELRGSAPFVCGYASSDEELVALVESVQDWMADGVTATDIGVVARTHRILGEVQSRLVAAGVPVRRLGADESERSAGGVELATMHRIKGLEYRCVAVIDAGVAELPARAAVTREEEDPVAHQHDMQRERCLLFVACTRARDTLRVTWSGPPSPFLTTAR
jgi:hypothetical protein